MIQNRPTTVKSLRNGTHTSFAVFIVADAAWVKRLNERIITNGVRIFEMHINSPVALAKTKIIQFFRRQSRLTCNIYTYVPGLQGNLFFSSQRSSF